MGKQRIAAPSATAGSWAVHDGQSAQTANLEDVQADGGQTPPFVVVAKLVARLAGQQRPRALVVGDLGRQPHAREAQRKKVEQHVKGLQVNLWTAAAQAEDENG